MKLYSNEIVFRGHPDKVCDQISDALLTAYLQQDKHSRCGIETMGGKGKIFITGEVTSNTNIDVEQIVKSVLSDVGYSTNYEIINNIGLQSADIALGTNEDVMGAGDQGMMFGYACSDTIEKLPTAMVILQKLSRHYDCLRQQDNRFLPDGKAQITGVYDNEFNLVEIKDFTISYQNTEIDRKETDRILINYVRMLCNNYNIPVEKFHINPTGKFLIGGFDGDAGLTGRKIVVDNYQSFANVGGGAFSGKDPTKVDRSGAYKARQIAKDMLNKYNLKWCEVQLSYAIGLAEPLAIYIDTDKGNIEPPKSLYKECTPKAIIDNLYLRDFDYYKTAQYGHFGNNKFIWEI